MKRIKKTDRRKAAADLLVALYLYPHYHVRDRGPAGCIIDALRVLHPKAAAELESGEDAGAIITKFFPERFGT